MAYEIVCESEAKRYRSDCSSVLTKTCEILKGKNIKRIFWAVADIDNLDEIEKMIGMEK